MKLEMRMKNKTPNGYTIYDGPSLLDNMPIICVALTGKSKNSKTGAMMQTIIIRKDIPPIEANRTGADFSICGACPHRGTPTNKDKGTASGRACHVTLMHSPNTVYKQFHLGAYPHLSQDELPELGKDWKIRIGFYGDGACIPSEIWKALLSKAKGHTGYSHQINQSQADFLASLYMQSVETEMQAFAAWSKNIRTFRIIKDVSEVVDGKEILCPASEEAGSRTTCLECGLCAGTQTKSKKSIAIVAHGAGKKHFVA